jgi:hypothetical protein
MRMRALLLAIAAAIGATAVAQSIASPSPSPVAREELSQAWWTGPLLAPSAGTLPRGHLLVEPYVYDVMGYATYDRHGSIVPATHSNGFGSLTYLIYGLTDRVAVGATPTFGYTQTSGGPNSNGIGIGDTGLLAQYRLTSYKAGSWIPIASIDVQETFPSGRYDRLGGNPSNSFGAGVYSTKLSLYTQTYAWMPNGRILRLRLNLSQSFSGSTSVEGASVYGTAANFRGSAQPGNTSTIDAAGEYSITQNWVAAADLVYSYSGNTRLAGTTGVTNLGPSHWFAFAPAIEYNWTANAGIIVGVRYFPAGTNTSASIAPALAVNMVR